MDEKPEARRGRPRRYDLKPPPNFASLAVGLATAALAFVPEGLTLSMTAAHRPQHANKNV
ncbi:MAG: hypothetical protein ACP5HG_15295 [Anaerolineae bacterium]